MDKPEFYVDNYRVQTKVPVIKKVSLGLSQWVVAKNSNTPNIRSPKMHK